MKEWVITAWSPSLSRRVNELRLVEQDRRIIKESLAARTAEAFAHRLNRTQYMRATDWQGEYRYLEVGQHTLVDKLNSL